MEKLHENPFVVNELERILKEDYPFLEYSDQVSKKLSEDFLKQVSNDVLYVRVIPRMERTDRDGSVIEDICERLSQATQIQFMSTVCPPARCYQSGDESSRQNVDTEWTAFRLYKAMINQDPNIHGGVPVFMGTRVPIPSLIHHLKAGESLDDFLEGFPSVSREQAIAFLEFASTLALEASTRQNPRRSQMINYKEINQRNREIGTTNATPEENKLKKKYGRIFESEHCTQRLDERGLEIRRDRVRSRLLELERFPAALFDEERKTLIFMVPQNKRDWLAETVFEVNGLAEARRKAQKEDYQFLVF